MTDVCTVCGEPNAHFHINDDGEDGRLCSECYENALEDAMRDDEEE